MAEAPGFEDSVIQRILSSIDPIIDGTAGQLGKPPDSARYTAEQQVQLATESPFPDPAMKLAELQAQGMPTKEIMDTVYPKWRPLIETGRPRVIERQKYGAWLGKEIEKRGGWPGYQAPVEADPMLPPAPEVLP